MIEYFPLVQAEKFIDQREGIRQFGIALSAPIVVWDDAIVSRLKLAHQQASSHAAIFQVADSLKFGKERCLIVSDAPEGRLPASIRRTVQQGIGRANPSIQGKPDRTGIDNVPALFSAVHYAIHWQMCMPYNNRRFRSSFKQGGCFIVGQMRKEAGYVIARDAMRNPQRLSVWKIQRQGIGQGGNMRFPLGRNDPVQPAGHGEAAMRFWLARCAIVEQVKLVVAAND